MKTKTIAQKNHLHTIFHKHKFTGAALVLAGLAIYFTTANANVTLTPASYTGTISADTTGGAYKALTGPVIVEANLGEVGLGTIILNAPTGFVFNTAQNVTATVTNGSCSGGTKKPILLNGAASQTVTPTASTITHTVTQVSGGNTACRGTITYTNIQVRPSAGTPLASGNITKSGTSAITGITNGTTNLGTLTEVVGAKSQLVYTTQPSATAAVGANFATPPEIKLADQFGNVVTTDSTSTIALSPVFSTDTCGVGGPTGTITSNPVSGFHVTSGVMTYLTMSYSAAENIRICATSTGVASALSNAINITAPAPTGTTAILQNSTATTVDMVVTGSNLSTFVSSGTATANATDRANITYRATNPSAAVINNATTMTLTFPLSIGTDKSGNLTIAADTVQNAGSNHNALITILNASVTDSAKPVLTALAKSLTGGKNRLTFTYSEPMTVTNGASTSIKGDITTAGTVAGFGSFATTGDVTVPTTMNTVAGNGTSTITVDLAAQTGGTLTGTTEPGGVFTPVGSAQMVDAASNQVLTTATPTASGNGTWDLSKPTVTNVTSSTSNGSYGTGAVIPVTVTFSEIVFVTGTPQLTLSTGSPATTVVNYANGSGTDTLTFTYTVSAGNASADLDYSATNSLALNGGKILDGATNSATLTLASPGAAGSLGANKAIVIDTTAPTVTNVTSTSSNGTYGTGAVIPVTVTFSETVYVTDTPQLTLSTGTPATTAVNLTSGNGTNTLTFNYTVSAGNSSADLDYAATNSLALNGGAIKDGANNNAVLTLASPGAAGSLGANKAIVIDGVAPTVTNVTSTSANGSYGVGSVIPVTVTFSEPVTVTNVPQIILATGTPATTAVNLTSGNGTATLTFNYTVVSGNDSSDLDYNATNSLILNGGTIKDMADNNATLTLASPGAAGSLGANKNIVIDAAAPTVTNVTSTSANGTYGAGAVIPVTVTFSENVYVTDTPQLTLSTGTPATTAVNLTSGNGTNTLTFNYTVSAGNSSADLDYAGTDSLALNGGAIKDGANNNAVLTLASPGAAGSLGANKNIVIDTTAPTVTNVTSTSSNGTYGTGAVIPVTVTFSENVYVTDTPQLTLSTGSPVTTAVNLTSGNGTNTLTFNYTVSAGNSSADLDYFATSSLALNGGAIKDGANNNAVLTLASPGAAGSLGANKNIVIDAVAPTVTNVTSTSSNGTYGTGAVIPVTVTFSETVYVTDTPQLTLSTGTPATTAVDLTSGHGTNILTFNYTVSAGNSSADLDYAATTSLALNGGAIRDGANNNAVLTLASPGAAGSLGANRNIVIDTTVPTVSDVSSTTADGSYKAGVTIPITVTFSEPVTVTDVPQLTLATGTPATTTVDYVGGSPGATLTFNYTIAAGNSSSDLDYAGTNSLTLNGGMIKDTATGAKNATLTLAAPGAAGSLGDNKDIVIDTANPSLSTVTIASNNGNSALAKAGDTVTVSFTASEKIQTPAVTIGGASASVAGGPTNWTASRNMLVTDTEGVIPFTIDYADLAGNGGTQVTTTTNASAVTLDRTKPVVTENTAVTSPTNDTTPTYTFDSSEAGAITYGGGCASATSSAVALPSHNPVTFNALIDNAYNCTINVTDATGNISDTLLMSAFVVDTTNPGVTISTTSSNPTKVAPIPFKATFTEAVTGFDATDIGIGNGSVTAFTPDLVTAPVGSVYDFEVTPGGQGLVTVDIAATRCKDLATNDNTVAVQLSRTFDNIQPSLTLSSTSPDPTNTAPIPFTATFSEPVDGFDLLDIAVGNGSAGNLAPAVGPSAVWTFDVTPTDPDPLGPNAFAVTVNADAAAARDAALNDNTAAVQVSRIFDSKKPTVSLTPVPSAYTNYSPISLTATFSKDVTGFYDVPTDVVVSNGTLTNFSPVSGSVYTFDINPTGQGAVTVDIPAGISADGAGNTNFAAAQFSTIYDSIAPSVTAAQALDSNGDGKMDKITLTFGEDLVDTASGSNGFDVTSASDHGLCNSEMADPDGTSSLTVDFDCANQDTAVDDLTLSLAANAAVADAAGNQVGSVSLTKVSVPAISDGADPIVLSTTPTDGELGAPFNGDTVVNFSEAMNTGSFTISDDDTTYTGNVWSNGNKTVTSAHNNWTFDTLITVSAGANDLAGNPTGSYGWSFTSGNNQHQGEITVPQSLGVTDAGTDLSNGINTSAAGNILIDGVTQGLNSITDGDIAAQDLMVAQIIGDQSVAPMKAVTLNSAGAIALQNAAVPETTVDIPNGTTLFGCNTWDGILTLKSGTNSGTAPSGFVVGTTVYEIGSASCPLLLSQPATIIITGLTGTTAYKPTGSSTWFSIPTCGGTYAAPVAPPAPVPFTECSITDGTDTKILTYHFTSYGTTSAAGGGGGHHGAGLYPVVGKVIEPAGEESLLTEEPTPLPVETQEQEELKGSAEELTEKACHNRKTTLNDFSDLVNNPNRTYIEKLYLKCAIEESSNKIFGVDKPVTRADLAKILVVMFKLGGQKYIDLYDDVKSTDPFAPYLLRAAKMGLIRSESINRMKIRLLKPGQELTRAEAINMMLKAKGVNLNEYDKPAVFVDVSPNDWFYKIAAFAQNEKLLDDLATSYEDRGQVRDLYKFPRLLGLGNSGKDVEDLKSIMMQLDYYSGKISNVYDRELADAVKAYQRANGITPSGDMGNLTRTKLLAEFLHPKKVASFRPNDLMTREETAKAVYLVDHWLPPSTDNR
jgi:hypothetical protein